MIIKHFEINKINPDSNKIFLFYGKNEGLKNETFNNLIEKNKKYYKYDEKEVLEKQEDFLTDILNQSLFDEKKIIVIKKATDKILKVLEVINYNNTNDIFIIIADNLEKKSKLRKFFEKEKNLICVPFYPDNEQTLSKLCFDYFRGKKISISTLNLNQIVNKASGDRDNLYKDLEKIENFMKGGKKLTNENLIKLVNLSENYSIAELVDNCLANNKKKFFVILNENNFSNEDCILILRTFLNKAKKILNLSAEYEKNNDLNLTISNAKPPIFWKDKEITKQQILRWKPKQIKELIYKINKIELNIKKNINLSINLITDFLIEESHHKSNN